MLILSRKKDEKVMIGDQVEICILEIRGDQVKLGINAPKEVKVYRMEVFEEILKQNRAAAQGPVMLPALDEVD